jgi:flagellar hook-associated protein 2
VPAATSDSRSVTIAPGLTLSLLAQSTPGSPTTITLTQSSSSLSTALSSLATAYNDAVDELDKHRGNTSDALAGQSVIYSASSALRAFSKYSPDSGSGSLSDMGITFDLTGHMTYNALTFMGKAFSDMPSVTQFLGSVSSGGLLQAATDAMNGLEAPTTGAIKGAMQSVSQSITTSNSRIADEQTRVDQLQERLLSQMSAADAAIAAMEQQYSFLSQMLDAMRINQQTGG